VADGPTACDCGRVIEQPKTGRKRRKCAVCSPPDLRDRTPRLGVVHDLPAAAAPDAPAPVTLVGATQAELAAVGRDGTPEGLIVLTLAAQIAAGGGSAAGLAALVREFHASKARALDGAQSGEADVIDGIFGT
jgi:hypothetical protein